MLCWMHLCSLRQAKAAVGWQLGQFEAHCDNSPRHASASGTQGSSVRPSNCCSLSGHRRLALATGKFRRRRESLQSSNTHGSHSPAK
ncbi:hypothetical protein WR25_12144 [Diploscapter pachys]|uniref:Secreted protein n=1 Tax=Diploscapter pachys TaxID=2018661 RepID=A0A2A2JAC4_9BILA|nr:hypothetical protein WR25_12144 [Diploscapter pachys]